MKTRIPRWARRALRWIFRAGLASAAALAAAAAVSCFAIEWEPDGSDDYPGGTVLRDRFGEVIRVSLGPGDVDCRPYYVADPEDWIVKALVASEDGEFWNHCGVRPLSALRALWQNLFFRRRISGASTISMQAVRLIRPHSKTYLQKWVEAVRAVKMERRRDKRWILSQYLNRAPFGSNLIGIEAAAQGWFGKGAKDLGIGEAAMLAGMVQAPSRFRPDRHYEDAVKRREYVLSRMLALGLITAEQAEGARSVRPELVRAPRPFLHPFYCDWYLREVAGRDRAGQRAYGDFTTPLDPDVQGVCESVVADAAAGGSRSAAAVVVDVASGDVIALAASGDYLGGAEGSQVNTALAPRPAGSTLKPLLAAQAMDLGIAGPATLIADRPLSVKGYRPANFDGRHRGDVSLSDSLVLSLNVPFVRLVRKVGVGRFADLLSSMGVPVPADAKSRLGLGIAIGNVDVTLVSLVGAYRRLALAASGSDGGPVSPAAAYLVTDALSGGERSAAGLGHVADVAAPRFAWKTGTSSAYRDAWTVMWNPRYVVGVWCGHLRGGFGDTSLVGARAAAPEAWRIARALCPGNRGAWFAAPPGADALAARAPKRLAERGGGLAVASPEDGALICLVEGVGQQKVVCRAAGCAEGARLWWFLDGAPVGETTGTAPLALDVAPGSHVVACADAEGSSADASFTVTR